MVALAQMPQPMPPIQRVVHPHLTAYLGLELAQQAKMLEVNARFQRYLQEKARRAGQVQNEIQRELGQPVPAPMALGLRYAEIEAICREATETRTRTVADMQGVLNAAQKLRFDALKQAFSLLPVIREGQDANLLPREIPGYKPPAPQRAPEFGTIEWGVMQMLGPIGLPGCRNPAPVVGAISAVRPGSEPPQEEP
jgi:hypothetical protein